MAEPNLTHAELTARLVADGLAVALGQPRVTIGVEADQLSDAEKRRIAANPGDLVVFYPLGETGVFFERGVAVARVWYEGVECTGAIDALDAALRKARAQKVSDAEHPELQGMKQRQYLVEIDPKHFVRISATYPASRNDRKAFSVQLFAQERRR